MDHARSNRVVLAVLFAAGCVAVPGVGRACLTHALSSESRSVAGLTASERASLSLEQGRAGGGSSTGPQMLSVPSLNAVASWKINYTGATATSPNATIQSFITNTTTDVSGVWWDTNYIYVRTNGVPSHAVGRADGNNPAYPRSTNQTLRIPRNPTPNTGTLTAVGNGQVAVSANGSSVFDGGDAQTYNNLGSWRRIALTFEGATFDGGPGHSAPLPGQMPSSSSPGTYHYHVAATSLVSQIDAGNTGQRHSPIVGFAVDGYPIYGPYGYSDPANPGSAIKLVTSSYQVRTDLTPGSARNRLTQGGAVVTGNQVGPNVNATFPAGAFKEDYRYVTGAGDLNSFNMRFTVTPEYPQGTWAYYMTLNANGTFAYPYVLGPAYYGVVGANPTASVAIPAGATRLLAGDANFDGAVNYSDLLQIAPGFGLTGVTLWSQGDFDSNIAVNGADLALLQANYVALPGSTFSADWAAALSTVPEPSGAAVMLLGAVPLGSRRRR